MLSVQSFDELLQDLAVRPRPSRDRSGALRGLAHQTDAIDEDTLGTHFVHRLQQQTIRRAQFLIEHFRAGEDDLKLLLRLEPRQIPAHAGRVTNEFIRTGFKHHNDTRLIELLDSLVYELDTE